MVDRSYFTFYLLQFYEVVLFIIMIPEVSHVYRNLEMDLVRPQLGSNILSHLAFL